ncbi:MAG: tetratricopeptide (TPR) repeat protein [Planctomycetota bacterium]
MLQQARTESWIYDEAKTQADDYLKHSGDNLDGLRIMQVVLRATGSISGELELLNGVQGDATHLSFKLQGIGIIKARLGLWIEAEENLKEAARLTPTDARAHGTLAEFYRLRGRSRDAVAAAARAKATLGTVQDEALREKIERTIMSCRLSIGILAGNGNLAAAPAYVRGCMHYARGDMTAAKSSFQQVGTGPDASAAQLGQAACLVNTGAFQEAYDMFVSVADQDPLLRHRAMTGLALICSRISDFDSALTFIDRALEASPKDTYALYLKGRTLRLMGQFAAAEEALAATLVQHDDFVHAIVEMSLVQSGLASQAIGADQAGFLIGARRYMDRAVALSPKPELELLEMQGTRAFSAGDRRAARAAFQQAEQLGSSDALKSYAKGSLCVVLYSRGRVEGAQDGLQRLERDVGRDSVMGKWAGDTLTDISDHAQKETLGDSFDRQAIGDIWTQNNDLGLKGHVVDGRMVFRGSKENRFSRNGGAVSVERANGVKPGKNFLACSVTMEVGPNHDLGNATVGLGIETRQARSGRSNVEFSARVGVYNGKAYVEVIDGRDQNGAIRVAPELSVPLRTDGPQELELRVEPRTGSTNNKHLQLLVYLNDALVLSHELKQLSGSTQNELRTVLFAEGDKGARVDLAFDDYKLERRKGK